MSVDLKVVKGKFIILQGLSLLCYLHVFKYPIHPPPWRGVCVVYEPPSQRKRIVSLVWTGWGPEWSGKHYLWLG